MLRAACTSVKFPWSEALRAGLIAVVLVAIGGHAAWSQSTRTVKLIVPVLPGGAPDILARVLAEQFGHTPGQAMVVENRPGASSVIGSEAVVRAEPDGKTLLMTTAQLIINPHLRTVGYDPLTSFEPICAPATAPTLIAVNSASPYRTLADLVGRRAPGPAR